MRAVKMFLSVLFLAVFTVPVWAQQSAADSAALENISSEDLLKLKEDLESQKSQLEVERADLLEKGLQQSKDFLEKGGSVKATSALVLLQRAEYLYTVYNDEIQVQLDSVATENARRLAEWDRERERMKAQWEAEGKKDKELEELLDQIAPPQQLQDPVINYSEIAKTYQQLIDNFPESQYVVDAMYNLAYIREQEGTQLRSLAFNDPDNPRYSQESDRKMREALKMYQNLAVRFPDSKYAAEAYNRIAEYYFLKGGDADLQRAIKNYAKVMDYPNSERFPEAVYKLAWTHYRMGDYPQAISYFTYLVDDVDTARHYNNDTKELDTEALVYIGISFNRWGEQVDLAQGTSEGGFKLIKSYIDDAKLNDKRYAPEIIWQLGESYSVEQKDTLALYAYNTLLESYPNFWRAPDAQHKIIQTYDRLFRQSNKQELLDSVLANRYKLYNAYKPKSEWSLIQDDKEVVAKGNRMARDVLVDNILYYYGEAGVSNQLEDWRKAMEFSREFIRFFPVDTNAYFFHYNLAVIQYRFFGLLDSAYEDYVKVATLYPQDIYRYDAAINAFNIADSLYRMSPFRKPAQVPQDSILPLTPGEEKLIDAINSYSRIFPDTISDYPVDSLQNPKPILGKPGKKTPDFLAYAGQIYYSHNDFSRASQYFNTIVSRYPSSNKVQISEQYLMQSYLDRKDFRSSEIVARRLYENPSSTAEQREKAVNAIFYSIFKRAENFLAAKENAKAAREFQRAYEEGVRIGYPKADEKGLALFKSAAAYANSKELRRSLRAYEMYADSFPKEKDAPNALWNIQYTYADLKEMKPAAKFAERLADNYPSYNVNNGQATAEIALYNAEYYLEQAAKRAAVVGDTVESKAMNYEAIRVSGKFVQRYPKSEYASTMDFGIANLYFLVNEEEKAYQKYRDFARTFPNDKRNVQALYDVGVNHLRKLRRSDAIQAFEDARKKSEDLKRQKLDFNRHFSSEAVYELARMKYEDFSKIELKEPGIEHKEDKKLSMIKELIDLYNGVTDYAQIRTYEAAYYRGFIREEFGDALTTKQFKQEKDLVKQIQAQQDAYFAASQVYRGAVDEYLNAFGFLDKAVTKFDDDQKAIIDSLAKKYPGKTDTVQLLASIEWEGKTAKEKEFSRARQKELAIKYRDLAKSRISRILYYVADTKRLIVEAYVNAPLPKEVKPGTIEYIYYQTQLVNAAIKPRIAEAIVAFERAAREMDSLSINDKYTSECRRNIVRFTGIVPSELAKVAFLSMDLYKKNSDHYREVIVAGENYVDKTTGLGFWDVFYEIPIEMNTFISQMAKPAGEAAIQAYVSAVVSAKEKNAYNEDAIQIEREMYEFAYQFATLNYTEADTSDKYYKAYEAEYFKHQDDEAYLYLSEASATYNQVLGFTRENARGVLEQAFNASTTLGLVTLQPDPTGQEGDEVAVTDHQPTKRIMALLGKYDEYYAKLLKLKTLSTYYASNYDDWLINNRVAENWQSIGYADASWYAAAPPPATFIKPHGELDTMNVYPMWLGLGRQFTAPKLPEYVAPVEIPEIVDEGVPVDSGAVSIDGDTTTTVPGEEAIPAETDTGSTQGYVTVSWTIGTVTIQDTIVKPVFSQAEITRQLDTTKIIYIRKAFNIAGSPQGGQMLIAADGLYDFYMNGAFIGTQLGEEADSRGDTVDVHDLFPENFVQGKNVLSLVLRDVETPEAHHGIRILLRVNEVEDITAQFAEPPLPATEQLKPTLFRRGRIVKSR